MTTGGYKTPGIYREDVFPAPEFGLLTGVPAFLGYARQGPDTPQRLTVWRQFQETFGAPWDNGYLAYAVCGFFDNDGRVCYVLRLDDDTTTAVAALEKGLEHLQGLDAVDLLCAPDIMRWPAAEVQKMQRAMLAHCEQRGDRLALLDALPDPTANVEAVRAQRQGLQGQGLTGANGALYYPWVWVPQPGSRDGKGKIPPCGHVAGVYARTDQRIGVHKAPANELLQGVVELEVNVTDALQGQLNPEGINCIRAFPGRGIRLWGARTLSADPAWMYVNVRRLFLTAGRWIERALAGVAFEPNNFLLWVRIERELRAYFSALFQQGALKGTTEEDAFYVQCDAETNPPEVQEAGMVVTEIGLAPAIPSEFVVVRLIHGASGVTIAGPIRPG